jgi:hypothetical protein
MYRRNVSKLITQCQCYQAAENISRKTLCLHFKLVSVRHDIAVNLSTKWPVVCGVDNPSCPASVYHIICHKQMATATQ